MIAGISALVSLSGGPHAPADLKALGLDPEPVGAPAVRLFDTGVDGVHSGVDHGDGATLAFMGHLDEPAELASRLACPPATSVARLVRLALARQGEAVMAELEGEWSLLHFGPTGVLLACSRCLRDPLCYASDGRRLAVSPSLATLASLAFVGDAVNELSALSRRIVRGQLARHGDVAIQLSGGLDSSLVALLAAEERRPGQQVFAVSSVAPPGSEARDEREFIHLAASHLGIGVVEVSPSPDQSPYQPSPLDLAHMEEPSCGPRHDLYSVLNLAAAQGGATGVFNGCFGEANLTRSCVIATPASRLRATAWAIRDQLHLDREPWPQAGMASRVSKAALAMIVDGLRPGPRRSHRKPVLRGNQLLGLPSTWSKLGRGATATRHNGLRDITPFRSHELTTFVARLPARFTVQGDLSRALARAMMFDRMPPAIATRTSKSPFSPDQPAALVRHAQAARDRLVLHRRHGADEWLDLDWLDIALEQMAQGRRSSVGWAMKVQASAQAAEFVTWWRTRGKS